MRITQIGTLAVLSVAAIVTADDLPCKNFNEKSTEKGCVDSFSELSNVWHKEFGRFAIVNKNLEPVTPTSKPLRGNLPLQPVKANQLAVDTNQNSEISVLLLTGAESKKMVTVNNATLGAWVRVPKKPGKFAGLVASFAGDKGKRNMYAGVIHFKPQKVASGNANDCEGELCAQLLRYDQKDGIWHVISQRAVTDGNEEAVKEHYVQGRLELKVVKNELELTVGRKNGVKNGKDPVIADGQVGVITNFDNEDLPKDKDKRGFVNDFRLVSHGDVNWIQKPTLVNSDNTKVLVFGTSLCNERKLSGKINLNVDTDRFSALKVMGVAPCDLEFNITGDFADHVAQVTFMQKETLTDASKKAISRVAVVENLSTQEGLGRRKALVPVDKGTPYTCVTETADEAGDLKKCTFKAQLKNNASGYYNEDVDSIEVRNKGFFEKNDFKVSELLKGQDLIDTTTK